MKRHNGGRKPLKAALVAALHSIADCEVNRRSLGRQNNRWFHSCFIVKGGLVFGIAQISRFVKKARQMVLDEYIHFFAFQLHIFRFAIRRQGPLVLCLFLEWTRSTLFENMICMLETWSCYAEFER
mmetsp:Transcript_40747/g.91664  ORF Transcript_40747/g.91664 Transcript_40747/m.91664 type:complete len:126 (+) Transcript_40747:753-1130(+)